MPGPLLMQLVGSEGKGMGLRGQPELESLGKVCSATYVRTETPAKSSENGPEIEFNRPSMPAAPT